MLYRISTKKLLSSLAILSLLFFSNTVNAGGDPAKGKEIFTNNCASCHAASMKKDATGPALKGVESRWADRKDIFAWIRGSQALVASGNPRAKEVFGQWKTV